jgi:hypothetical protein
MARPKSDVFERIVDDYMKMTAEERTELLGMLRGVGMAEARRPRTSSNRNAIAMTDSTASATSTAAA